jgi:hypothetical protein
MGSRSPYWVREREAADFIPEGDHIVCRWGDTEWVFSPAVAQIISVRLREALAKWQVGQLDKVTDIRAH